ncbi:MAG: YheT family hydrolase [Thermodesulfobacteriota bacterium]
MNPFTPPALFKNPHLQTIAASVKLRRPLVRSRAAAMLAASREMIVDAGDGVRLQGFYSPQPDEAGRGLVILIHGWEGSADSMYLVSAAGCLYNQGLDVFRLNLRDHGNSHHLNPGLFHSCRIDEVTGAVKRICADLSGGRPAFLAGFSLGGNFALRVALRAPGRGFVLDKVVAVCPVLHPPTSMASLESGWFGYHYYFIRKWKQSLRKKQALFPDLYDFNDPAIFKSLSSITACMVKKHTDFPDLLTYLNGYAITGDVLAGLSVSCHIIASKDDPIIPSRDYKNLARPQSLTITLTDRGGHCGFLTGPGMRSWADKALASILLTPEKALGLKCQQ